MISFAERIKPYNIKWFAQFRVNDVRREVLEELVAAGLMFAGFGIESMNDDVLKSMKKHTTRTEIVTALETARQARLLCSGNIILGDPADTEETLNESVTWWKNNPVYNVSLGFILAVPDAPVYRYALEKGIIKNRLAHIRGKLPLVNLSKISDKQYYTLVLKVCWWNIMWTYATPGILIGTRRLEECFGDKHFHELQLRCPFCGSEQTHKKFMASPTPNVVIYCTHCFSRFKIPQKRAFPDDYSFTTMVRYMLIKLAMAYTTRFRIIRDYRYVVKQMLDRFGRL
jgi:hypothetical protein